MVKSLYSGVTGLKTHQQRMDVIGNNIANVNTIGYKVAVVTFADVYYQTKNSPTGSTTAGGGVNPRQVGYGVKMSTTTPNFAQTGYYYSDNKWDLALNGEGFFQVMNADGEIFYTRAGAFSVDEMGYVVNSSGYYLCGVSGNSENQQASTERLRLVVNDTEDKASTATKLVNGTNVTLSVSAPSNNTNISVTFTESEYPYATYANGVLNIYFNSDEQYESQEDFEAAINNAINNGGVELPDGVELVFEFDGVPADTAALPASVVSSDLNYSTTYDTAKIYGTYTLLNGATGYAYMAFQSNGVQNPKQEVVVNYTATGTASVSMDIDTASGQQTWTITVNKDITKSGEINTLIEEYLAANYPDGTVTYGATNANGDMLDANGNVTNDPTQQAQITANIMGFSCTAFSVPRDPDMRQEAFDNGLADSQKLNGGSASVVLTADVVEAGEFGNDYKIVYGYKSGCDRTSAAWDEKTLTIYVCDNSTADDIQAAVDAAAKGNPKKNIKVTVNGLDNMNAEMRSVFFGGNPSISPKEGADSFYTEIAKSLQTFVLQDGRIGEAQTYGNLEDVIIQRDGTILGYHAVHGYITLGRIDIATFDNPNGLSAVGGTMFIETVASGKPQINIAGTKGAGEVLSGALEMSNVDLSQEFTDMITTQRGFQANSRVITVSDTMLEELLSLKR